MLEYDPVASLQHFPVQLSQFGENPYGGPLYRVVSSPSRRYLVCGEWPDGSRCFRWANNYHVGNRWVLEGWQSALDFSPAGREDWDLKQAATLGPWPERGEYTLIEVFYDTPTLGLIEKLISMSRYGHEHYKYTDHVNFQRDAAIRETAMKRDMADALLKDRLPAYGVRAMSGGRFGRRSRSEDADLKSAEELGLPTTPGMRVIPRQAA